MDRAVKVEVGPITLACWRRRCECHRSATRWQDVRLTDPAFWDTYDGRPLKVA